MISKVVFVLVFIIGAVISQECDNKNPTSRVDCGSPGITEQACKAKGCCFDNKIPNVKWCFTKKSTKNNDDTCAQTVILHDLENFEGDKIKLCPKSTCQTVPVNMDNKASSLTGVDGLCVTYYDNQDCTGPAKISFNKESSKKLILNDKISSYKTCSPVLNPTAPSQPVSGSSPTVPRKTNG